MSLIKYILLALPVLASGFLVVIQFSMTGKSDLILTLYLAVVMALYLILYFVVSKIGKGVIKGIVVILFSFLLGFMPYDTFLPHSYQIIFDTTYRDSTLSNIALRFPFPISVMVELLFFFFLHFLLFFLFSRITKKAASA